MLIRSAVTEIASVGTNAFIIKGKSTNADSHMGFQGH